MSAAAVRRAALCAARELCGSPSSVRGVNGVFRSASDPRAPRGCVRACGGRADTEDTGSTALAALNGRDVLGSQLGVVWHVVQGAKEDTSQHITVFCGNIGDQIDEYTLYEAFVQYNCSDSRIVRGDDGRCLGYGFVTIRTQVQ